MLARVASTLSRIASARSSCRRSCSTLSLSWSPTSAGWVGSKVTTGRGLCRVGMRAMRFMMLIGARLWAGVRWRLRPMFNKKDYGASW